MTPSAPGAPEPRRQSEKIRDELRELVARAAVSLALEGSAALKPEERTPTLSPVPRSGKRTGAARRSASLSAFLLATAIAIAIVHWWPQPAAQLPDNLQGRWTTTAPSFTGRELIIGSRTLGFSVDPEEPEQIYTVTARRITPRGSALDVRIEYQAPEGRFVMTLSLSPDGIRLANRSEVLWTRIDSMSPGRSEKVKFTATHFRSLE